MLPLFWKESQEYVLSYLEIETKKNAWLGWYNSKVNLEINVYVFYCANFSKKWLFCLVESALYSTCFGAMIFRYPGNNESIHRKMNILKDAIWYDILGCTLDFYTSCLYFMNDSSNVIQYFNWLAVCSSKWHVDTDLSEIVSKFDCVRGFNSVIIIYLVIRLTLPKLGT